jgi:hypothetical protein
MANITVVGLKNNQARSLERHFAGIARFTFVPADRCDTRLPLGAEWVIFSRFVPHRWTVAARHQLPRSRVAFCVGGVVSVIRQVAHIVDALEPTSRAA